jgi:hypothetical protein
MVSRAPRRGLASPSGGATPRLPLETSDACGTMARKALVDPVNPERSRRERLHAQCGLVLFRERVHRGGRRRRGCLPRRDWYRGSGTALGDGALERADMVDPASTPSAPQRDAGGFMCLAARVHRRRLELRRHRSASVRDTRGTLGRKALVDPADPESAKRDIRRSADRGVVHVKDCLHGRRVVYEQRWIHSRFRFGRAVERNRVVDRADNDPEDGCNPLFPDGRGMRIRDGLHR